MFLLIIFGTLALLSILFAVVAIVSWMRFEFGSYSDKTQSNITSNNNQGNSTEIQK